MRISVTIPSLNEGAWLHRTVRSIRRSESPDMEVIHVDDASTRPEPDLSEFNIKEIHCAKRQGAARARAIGIIEGVKGGADVLGTVDSHMLFGAGDALCGLVEEQQRFQTIDGQVRPPIMWEAGVCIEPNKISRLAQLAYDHNCFTYMTPCRMGGASIYEDRGFYRVRYTQQRDTVKDVQESAAMNGGCYFGSREAWEKIGGYPQLPGHFGFEEEVLALLAAATKTPILLAGNLSPWHLFRSQGVDPVKCPYTTSEPKELENLAAVYRMPFSERYWREHWRPLLKSTPAPGRNTPCPEYVLKAVETPEFTAYCDDLQKDFVLHDEEILAELNTRMARDREFLS